MAAKFIRWSNNTTRELFNKNINKDGDLVDIYDEFKFARSVGVISPRLLRMVSYFTEVYLNGVVKEWNADEKQKELLHESGIKLVKEQWDKIHISSGQLVDLYKNGVDKYVKEHKRLV